ncbi:uncharacterized protein LOC111019841 [Momordica charantia]|uniref:Uncharacterized protein LOC111019841 n=1 Tax=Momordica charantia TaxID=3673 RepID=A0A6J1DF34_MOMCH|nr:uncharacterized protein LOC111019841 [Momordica charantia]
MTSITVTSKELVNELEEFGVKIIPGDAKALLAQVTVKPTLRQKIIDAQQTDVKLCVPSNPSIRREVLEEAHNTPFSVHPGSTRMYRGLKQHYWWHNMKKENISMDFIAGLPRTTKGYTTIWVIVDRLTKSAHLIPGQATYTVEKWADLYIKEIVRLHGVPVSIVSDRDARFTSSFLEKFAKGYGH